jgi:hypothetical protein
VTRKGAVLEAIEHRLSLSLARIAQSGMWLGLTDRAATLEACRGRFGGKAAKGARAGVEFRPLHNFGARGSFKGHSEVNKVPKVSGKSLEFR